MNKTLKRVLVRKLAEAGSDFIATEKDLQEIERKYKFISKEGGGVEIIFAVLDGKPVKAIMNDYTYNISNSFLDKDNMLLAFYDFDKFLNS